MILKIYFSEREAWIARISILTPLGRITQTGQTPKVLQDLLLRIRQRHSRITIQNPSGTDQGLRTPIRVLLT